MRLAWLQLDVRALRSRVARRLFVIFLAGSLFPVTGFALFGYSQVRSQLESDAYLALGRDAKTAGMSILERLMIVEVNLRSLMRGTGPDKLPGILAHHVGAGLAPPEPLERKRAVVVIANEGDHPRIEMFAWDSPTRRWLVAEVDPVFIFVPERRRADQRYWVETKEGRLLFAAPVGPEMLAALASRTGGATREHFALSVGAETDLATEWPLFLGSAFVSGEWHVGMSRSREAVLEPLSDFEASFPLIAFVTVGLAALLTLVELRRTLVPLDALSHFADDVGSGDLDARVAIESGDEFQGLGAAFNKMADEIGLRVHALGRLNSIGRSLSSQRDVDGVLDEIVAGVTELIQARACLLFLEQSDGSLGVARMRGAGLEDREPGFLEGHLPVVAARHAVAQGQSVLADMGRTCSPEEEREWTAFRTATGIGVRSSLAVPLRTEQGDHLGALVLLSAEPSETAFTADRQDLAESLASQAAIAIRQGRLVDSLRALFEGLINLTVHAIDEKSAYTGEHCRKVPILTELIAEAVCDADTGPLKHFELSADERYELRVAALLHDCGKVVTPVHVMDKSTKLETIFDGIELIRTRFEVVRRDLLIRSFEGSGASRREDPTLALELAQLDDDLAFLERSNRGGEFMRPGDQQRVAQIGTSRYWTAADGTRHPLLGEDEMENLSISRGTLNKAEREVINDHVVATINLLQELPFPPELKNVPAIAGAHHERVDGQGFPNRLSGDQLTMQARILGLADVFEALTAKDRPYKAGKPLSQTLEILGRMAAEGHIDPDLHELFVREKVYLRYAAEHMESTQIDSPYLEELEERTAPWS